MEPRIIALLGSIVLAASLSGCSLVDESENCPDCGGCGIVGAPNEENSVALGRGRVVEQEFVEFDVWASHEGECSVGERLIIAVNDDDTVEIGADASDGQATFQTEWSDRSLSIPDEDLRVIIRADEDPEVEVLEFERAGMLFSVVECIYEPAGPACVEM